MEEAQAGGLSWRIANTFLTSSSLSFFGENSWVHIVVSMNSSGVSIFYKDGSATSDTGRLKEAEKKCE